MEKWYFNQEIIQQSIGEEVNREYCLALDHIAKDLLFKEGQNHSFGRVGGYPNPIGKSEEIFRDLYYRLSCEKNPKNEMFNIAFGLEEEQGTYILSCHTADNKRILWQERLDKNSIDKVFHKVFHKV